MVVVRSAALWGVVVTGSAALVLLLPREDVPGLRATPAIALAAASFVLSLWVSRFRAGLPDRGILVFVVVGFGAMVVEVWLFGPRMEVAAVVLVGAQSLLFLFVGRRMLLLANAIATVGFGLVVLLEDGYVAPHLHLLTFAICMVASTAVASWAVGHIERLATQEREAQAELARAHLELAELNRQLEARVDEQGAQIGSLTRLRQFLSPQVAEAVLHDGMEVLAPHRCRIAVAQCGLRGFPAFSSTAEPEEVMEVLDRYYVVVGRALEDRRATVGALSGDGVMAYFGDPIAHEDAPGTAVQMALSLREPMAEVVAAWRRRGFDLGFGAGVAYGYATVGPVGFAERTDYTALGPTVNLAARLCGEAVDGEVLIDGRTLEAVEGRAVVEPRELQLAGHRRPVLAHNVVRWADGALAEGRVS